MCGTNAIFQVYQVSCLFWGKADEDATDGRSLGLLFLWYTFVLVGWLVSPETDRASEDFDIADSRFASECHEEWCCWVVILVEKTFGAKSVEDVCGVSAGMAEEVVAKSGVNTHRSCHCVESSPRSFTNTVHFLVMRSRKRCCYVGVFCP